MAKKQNFKGNEDSLVITEKIEEMHIKKYVHPSTLNNIKLTEKQRQLVSLISNNVISLITGPAGTAKTFTMCYYAIKLLKENKIKKIILTKPIEESGEKLGFLPGTIDEKIAPYIESFKDNFLKLIPKITYDKLIKDEVIVFRPLAYMRGVNFDNCLVLADEFQNADIRQNILLTTRLGKESNLIIAGDINQSDIDPYKVSFEYFIKMVDDIDGVGVFRFSREDIMRHPILIEITDRYENAKINDKNFPKNKR